MNKSIILFAMVVAGLAVAAHAASLDKVESDEVRAAMSENFENARKLVKAWNKQPEPKAVVPPPSPPKKPRVFSLYTAGMKSPPHDGKPSPMDLYRYGGHHYTPPAPRIEARKFDTPLGGPTAESEAKRLRFDIGPPQFTTERSGPGM